MLMMSKNKPSSAIRRLKQDYMRLKSDPVPYIIAEPIPSNILEWHYVVRGPEQTPYEGGYYHGKLVFPKDFPFRPPAIYMITPNGRFKTNTRLCLSISDFHPDTWNPAWSVSTILTGLLSFMLEKTPTVGSLESSESSKRSMAYNSLDTNLKHKLFCELFPETVEEIQNILKDRSANNDPICAQPTLTESSSTAFMTPIRNNKAFFTIQGAVTNICVLVVFIIFAYIVRFVLKSE